MDAEVIDRVRSFNRTVSQRIGALDDAYLSRARPLGQARLLWEIGSGADAVVRVRTLRTRLGLDSGYVSRLLRALEAEGLVTVAADPHDARVRTARLTPAGVAERAELDRRSDELAASILGPLGARQRERLAAAMAEVERLLTASMAEIAVVDPRDPRAEASLAAYFAELAQRCDGGYSEERAIPAKAEQLTPPAGLFMLATLLGEPVGCGGLKFHGAEPAEVKRVWVSPTARGLGLGRRLLTELEARAAAQGARAVRLDTNRALTEAITLYRSTGYHEVPAFNDEPYADHWFEKSLDGEAASPRTNTNTNATATATG